MNRLQDLWTSLTAPISSDPNEALREYMTRVILLILGILMIVFTIPVVIWWNAGVYSLEAFIITLFLLVSILAGFWRAYNGHWQTARHIPPVLLFALGLYFSFIAPLGIQLHGE